MTDAYTQQARDSNAIHEIKLSCSVVKRHASFVGVEAEKMVRLDGMFAPGLMDEINEAAGVLQRALDRIAEAKQTLLSKQLEAAE